jgi:hypothetical protein
MEDANFVEVDAQDQSFIEIEALVEDTQLSAESVCACGIPTGMCSCIGESVES